MTTTPLPEAPVLSPIGLTARWSDLLHPPQFSRRSLWLGWMGADGVMLPLLAPVDDLPHAPDEGALAGLLELHRAAVEGTGAPLHLATALSRPGVPSVTANDSSGRRRSGPASASGSTAAGACTWPRRDA